MQSIKLCIYLILSINNFYKLNQFYSGSVACHFKSAKMSIKLFDIVILILKISHKRSLASACPTPQTNSERYAKVGISDPHISTLLLFL